MVAITVAAATASLGPRARVANAARREDVVGARSMALLQSRPREGRVRAGPGPAVTAVTRYCRSSCRVPRRPGHAALASDLSPTGGCTDGSLARGCWHVVRRRAAP